MVFPVICPVCRADSGRRVIPTSPDVDSFQCGQCRHEWSEPIAATAPTFTMTPKSLDTKWVEVFSRKK